MKKQAMAMVAACACMLAATAQAGPGWAVTDSGAVQAQWTDWTAFQTGFAHAPDVWTAYDLNGDANDPAGDPADALGEFSTYPEPPSGAGIGEDGILIEDNYDFSLWVPTFAGQDVLEVEFQVTYWDDSLDDDWRQGWDFSVDIPEGETGTINPVLFIEEDHDIPNELITEVYGFSVSGSSPSGVFIDFNADPALSVSEAYVDSIVVDGISYNVIPEPSVLGLLVAGGACLLRRRKRA